MITGIVDLHTHTSASDGSLAPAALVALAAKTGLRAVAITDHDTLSGLGEALQAGSIHNVEVIPGIEIGVKDEEDRDLIDVDILGYFIDPGDRGLDAALKSTIASRKRWVVEQIQVLTDQAGLRIPEEEVWDAVGRSPTPRRPHIWKVLQRHNPGSMTCGEYFASTDFGGIYFVQKTFEITLEVCIDLICAAGGVPVLAHPEDYPKIKDKNRLVQTCMRAGIKGIEVYYPYRHNRLKCTPARQEEIIETYRQLASALGLAGTGGSDFHGDSKPDITLGEPPVPYACLGQLRDQLGPSVL